MWSGSIERFPWFAHIFDLTIFPTDPTRQLSSKKFSLSALEGQSRPGRAFLASFYDFRPLNAFFAQFSTQETIWMLDFVVFHQTLDISIHSSQMVDIMTPELACFRRKNATSSLLRAIWPLLNSKMRQISAHLSWYRCHFMILDDIWQNRLLIHPWYAL